MTNLLQLRALEQSLRNDPNIDRWKAADTVPGVSRVRFYFKNGHGASLITSQIFDIELELAPLDGDGEVQFGNQIIRECGGDDVLRGTAEEIVTAIHALASQTHDKEVTQ